MASRDYSLQNSRFVPLASLVPQIPPCSTTFICTTTTKIVVVIGVSSLTTHSQHKLTFYLYYIHRRWSVKFFCLSVVFHMFEVSKLLIYCSAFNHTSCARICSFIFALLSLLFHLCSFIFSLYSSTLHPANFWNTFLNVSGLGQPIL